MLATPILAQQDQPQPNPQALAARCVQRTNHIAARSVRQIRSVGRAAVIRINTLIANDQTDQAAELAASVTENINTLADNRIERINTFVGNCTDALTELDAPSELIDGVQTNAANRVGNINTAADNAASRIAEALASE